MARTVAEVIAAARAAFNDPDADARTDATLIGYVLDALNYIRTIRPDLFLGQYRTSIAALTAGSNLPIDDRYFQAVYDYVTFRAEMTDDEYANNGRAELAMKLTQGMLT